MYIGRIVFPFYLENIHLKNNSYESRIDLASICRLMLWEKGE
jgi:hypothetical protein